MSISTPYILSFQQDDPFRTCYGAGGWVLMDESLKMNSLAEIFSPMMDLKINRPSCTIIPSLIDPFFKILHPFLSSIKF